MVSGRDFGWVRVSKIRITNVDVSIGPAVVVTGSVVVSVVVVVRGPFDNYL